MAGKAGLAERLDAGLDRLAGLFEQQTEALCAAPAENAATAEKVGKAIRSLCMGGRSIAEAGLAVDRLRADPADEDADDEGADDEEPNLDPEAIEALRADVRRRYSRFDRSGGGPGGPDRDDGSPGPAGGAARLARSGAWPAAAAPG